MVGKTFCDSCGRPMYGVGTADPDNDNVYCEYCVNAEGSLKTYEEVKEGLVKFYIDKYNYPRNSAEETVINLLKMMPAWEKRTSW